MNNKSEDLDKKNTKDDLSDIQENKIDERRDKKSKKNFNQTNVSKPNAKFKKSVDDSANDLDSDLGKEVEKLKEEKLRLLAEMENLRKRFEKGKIDSIKYGSINLARDILSTNDNLSRALNAVPSEENRPQFISNLIYGLKMVQKEFTTILEKHGVEKIVALNKKFDHNYHQAILEVETDEFEEGMVAQEIQSGFIMHDRLLRPSMVGVSKKLKNKKKDKKQE